MEKIIVKQGEAKTITFTVKDALGVAVDLSGATLLLGVKKDKGDATYTFSKVDANFDKTQAALGIVSVPITATDTTQPPATYTGELKMTWSETLVQKSADLSIEIKKAVTA